MAMGKDQVVYTTISNERINEASDVSGSQIRRREEATKATEAKTDNRMPMYTRGGIVVVYSDPRGVRSSTFDSPQQMVAQFIRDGLEGLSSEDLHRSIAGMDSGLLGQISDAANAELNERIASRLRGNSTGQGGIMMGTTGPA